jgi:hypothetical protein
MFELVQSNKKRSVTGEHTQGNGNSQVGLRHAMKAYGQIRSVASLTINLGEMEVSGQCHALALYPVESASSTH